MSRFDSEWLDLREPADRKARDTPLLQTAAALVERRPGAIIVDLGCGTGALTRAFAGQLPPGIRWRLIDADRRMLDAARERLAPAAACTFIKADIADAGALALKDAGLVTASALLDLVSAEWVERLGNTLRDRRVGFHATLNYDGTMTWAEPHRLDAAAVAAFNAHQRQDKGFGPALGPTAPATVERLFEARDFTVRRAHSPWILQTKDADLHRALVAGVADAAIQAGMDAGAARAWRAFRMDAADHSGCRVGHVDLLAVPRGR